MKIKRQKAIFKKGLFDFYLWGKMEAGRMVFSVVYPQNRVSILINSKTAIHCL